MGGQLPGVANVHRLEYVHTWKLAQTNKQRTYMGGHAAVINIALA